MKYAAHAGVLLLLLGLLAFVVPIPYRENHGLKIGKTIIGVQTESEKLHPAIGWALLAGGVLALVLGSRKSWYRIHKSV